MKNSTTIQCPECGSSINVNDILKHQIEESLRQDFETKIKQQEELYKAKRERFLKEQEDFEAAKANQEEAFRNQLAEATKVAEKNLHQKIQRQLEEEQSEKFELMNKELLEKSAKIKELGRMQAKISQLEREKSEMKDELLAEAEKSFTEKIAQKESVYKS